MSKKIYYGIKGDILTLSPKEEPDAPNEGTLREISDFFQMDYPIVVLEDKNGDPVVGEDPLTGESIPIHPMYYLPEVKTYRDAIIHKGSILDTGLGKKGSVALPKPKQPIVPLQTTHRGKTVQYAEEPKGRSRATPKRKATGRPRAHRKVEKSRHRAAHDAKLSAATTEDDMPLTEAFRGVVDHPNGHLYEVDGQILIVRGEELRNVMLEYQVVSEDLHDHGYKLYKLLLKERGSHPEVMAQIRKHFNVELYNQEWQEPEQVPQYDEHDYDALLASYYDW